MTMRKTGRVIAVASWPMTGSQKIEASGAVKPSPPPSIPRAMMLTRLSFEWSGPNGRIG